MDLMSPPLASCKPHSWVWCNGWVETCIINERKIITCLFPGCRKTFKSINGSMTNVKNHLEWDHLLTKDTLNNGSIRAGDGPLERALVNHGKRPADHFSAEDWSSTLTRFMVHNKLPFTFFEDLDFQVLLFMVQEALSKDLLKLPSNDTMARKVNYPPLQQLIMLVYAA